jgi:hypothetical protein
MRTTVASALALGLLATACTVGSTDDLGDDSPPDPATGEISGAITSDQTWSGEITIIGETTIAAGATVTVEPGTAITARSGVTVRVTGALNIAGTEAAPVSLLPTADALTWAGIVADPGGSVSIAYAEGTDVATLLYCHAGAVLCTLDHVDFVGLSQAVVAEDTVVVTRSRIVEVANGGLTVRGAGDLTVRDSYVLTSTGDIIVQNGGTLLIEYSEIGDAQGTYDHCNLHISSAASLTITHTNIINGVYGMMLGGTTGAVMTYNNWSGNDFDISEVGDNTAVDARYSYWASGAPALGAAYDVSSPSATLISDAGPRE